MPSHIDIGFFPLLNNKCKNHHHPSSHDSFISRFLIIFILYLTVGEAYGWETFPKCKIISLVTTSF
jgi:hypothetical protein